MNEGITNTRKYIREQQELIRYAQKNVGHMHVHIINELYVVRGPAEGTALQERV